MGSIVRSTRYMVLQRPVEPAGLTRHWQQLRRRIGNMRRCELFNGGSSKTCLLCFSLLCFVNPVLKTQEATAPRPKPSAAPSSVYTQVFLACSNKAPCTRTDTFRVDPLPNGGCVLTVRNGDGHGIDEARSYEVFLNGEKVVPVHRIGNAKAPVKVLSSNTLKMVLTGESFRKVFIEILCDQRQSE
jgi:hypothetical protein